MSVVILRVDSWNIANYEFKCNIHISPQKGMLGAENSCLNYGIDGTRTKKKLAQEYQIEWIFFCA